MPKSTMTEETQWRLPKDEPLPAVLKSVEAKVINYTNKRTGQPDSFEKWNWDFEIIDGPYAGLHAWGDTEDRLTTHPDNKVRQWAEVLRGKEFELGEGIDTDDLLGLTCVITVDNTTYEKSDGTVSYLTPVLDVFPPGTGADPWAEPAQPTLPEEPPF